MDQDPTPGDIDEMARVETRYREVGDKADVALRFVRQGGGLETGRGSAVEALRKQIDDLPDKLRKTVDSFHTAADAYRDYAPKLTEAQSMLDDAMDQAQSVAGQAAQTVPALPAGADDRQQADARQQQARIDEAQGKLTAAKRLAQSARELREQAQRTCADALDRAAGQAIPERNFFQKIADFFRDFPFIQIILATLIAIVSVFFPVVGLLLGGALFAFNQVVAIGSGNFKAGDFLAGLIGLVPGGALVKLGGRALTTFAPRLVNGLRNTPLVKNVSGSITSVNNSLANSRVVGPAANFAKEAGTRFAGAAGLEVIVKAANGDQITAGNILAGAAGGAVVGAGIGKFRGARGTGNGTSQGGTTPPVGAGGVFSDAARNARNSAGEQIEHFGEQVASSGAKIGVAVGEGSSFADALNTEGANLVPQAPGPAGKKPLADRADGFIPVKTSGGGPAATPAQTSPAATPPPAPPAAPAPPAVTPTPTPVTTGNGNGTGTPTPAVTPPVSTTPPGSPVTTTSPPPVTTTPPPQVPATPPSPVSTTPPGSPAAVTPPPLSTAQPGGHGPATAPGSPTTPGSPDQPFFTPPSTPTATPPSSPPPGGTPFQTPPQSPVVPRPPSPDPADVPLPPSP
ncbi:hypothetical protein ACFYYH_18715 [Streptomyces sp. NPDC002018]|uniref:hypothetical protein n=1 Tax=Streptomyces sp. NPDC002018 TaxID=3364629 RepID=UPI00368F8AF0